MHPDPGGTVTEDAVLGGRLLLRQPKRGHRVGHDAILLAAATGAKPGEHAVELGAGVGAAGLTLARRVPGLRVTLLEIDAALAALAGENAARNGLADRVRALAFDVTAPKRQLEKLGLGAASADRVLMNPPFNDPVRHRASPDARRRLAHSASGMLGAWIDRALWLLEPSGSLTLIWRADDLGRVLSTLSEGFGALAVLPVHPRPDAAAIRILVHAVKGSRAPLALLPGLMLNDKEGRPTGEAEAVLRGGEPLPVGR